MELRLNPYLVMDGNAREAVAFYQQALNAKVVSIMTFGEMPAHPDHPLPDDAKDRIMHALLKVGETDLMLSDVQPGMTLQAGDQVTISLQTDDADRARQIFAALAEGGKAAMPIQQTFWSEAYGLVTDRFGVPWQINTVAKG